MGLHLQQDRFDEKDYARFSLRLRACLDVLRGVLARPDFGTGPPTIGAELELFLVDGSGRPAAVNDKVLATAAHPALTLEADRFNLECRTDPVALAGRPFTRLREQLESTLTTVQSAAAAHGARPAAIGILPTLLEADLQPDVLSASARYRALSAGLRRLRQEPFEMAIDGADPLRVRCDDVTFEGANCSWQVHLKVPPADFARTYNAAQIAVAPVLAAGANSPTFLGRRLWQETRIALYRLSVDDRFGVTDDDWRPARVSFGHGWARDGAWELFAEAVALHAPLLPLMSDEEPQAAARAGVPQLAELRIHQGSVWHWNRAIYDPAGGGHVRIEMRPLPAGPTLIDMAASSAFLLGLTLALVDDVDHLTAALTFGQARRNFYQAARYGLGAELLWPTSTAPSPQPVTARSLIERLLPLALDGLLRAGVDRAEAAPLLDIVAGRVTHGITGASWQLATLAALETRHERSAALAAMLDRYMANAASAAPVHTWKGPS